VPALFSSDLEGEAMKTETALGSAMKTAGVDTDAAMLYAVAQDVLRRHGVNAMTALGAFIEELSDSGGLWSKLLSVEEKRSAGLRYLNSVARDMRGGGPGERVQKVSETHGTPGPSPDSIPAEAGGAVHAEIEGQLGYGRAINSNPSKDGGAVQTARGGNAQAEIGRAETNRESGGERSSRDERAMVRAASPQTRPGKPRSLADLAKLKAMSEPTIFDTITLRDGTPIGDLRWSQLDRFIADNAHEAALLRLVKSHAVPSDPNARVRDVVKLAALQRFVQQAKEVCDA
jgi:hypothetical protein